MLFPRFQGRRIRTPLEQSHSSWVHNLELLSREHFVWLSSMDAYVSAPAEATLESRAPDNKRKTKSTNLKQNQSKHPNYENTLLAHAIKNSNTTILCFLHCKLNSCFSYFCRLLPLGCRNFDTFVGFSLLVEFWWKTCRFWTFNGPVIKLSTPIAL